jgi:hypothetical protein
MTSLPELYLGAAIAVIVACWFAHQRTQRGQQVSPWFLFLFVAGFSLIAVSGVIAHNYEYFHLWIAGETLQYGMSAPPFGIPWQIYYLSSLAILVSPTVSLLPTVLRRPWMVAALTTVATFPLIYAKLNPSGC